MPPVRWKLFLAVILACLTQQIVRTDSIDDSIPIASDGWRPIVGTVSHREAQDEITLYKNPSQTDENSEPVKAAVFTPPPTSSTKPYQTITNKDISSASTVGNKPQSVKVPPHQKKPFIVLANHAHGPHIPLTASGHRGPPHRHPAPNKSHPPHGKKHVKPIRGQMVSHSNKHEVYVPAPSSSIGAFTFFNQPQGPVKLREAQGLPGIKQFHISQIPSHGPIEFAGHFAIPGIPGPSDTIIQQVPVQTLLIQNRSPIQNNGKVFSNQNDEYTRNLVPPPYTKPIQQEKEKKQGYKQQEQMSVVAELASNINSPQLVVGKHKDHRTTVPENIIVQLPPAFGQPSQFAPNYIQYKPKERDPVEVQVTREKLKVFHNNIPSNYNPSVDPYEQQYDYQDVNKPIEETKVYTFESLPIVKKQQKQEIKQQVFSRKPIVETAFPVFQEPKRDIFKKPVSEAPSFPTYEVTEDKNWQEAYQPFLSTRPTIVQEQLRPIQQEQLRPIQQEPLHTPTPIRIQAQPMQIAFLPTPYTDGSVPTSPTQSEISDIYTELNQKNRQYQFSTFDPNFFSIREVSTHYPIVGRPESPTLVSIPSSSENTEFSNEITTVPKEEKREPFQIYQPVEEPEPTVPPTRTSPTRDWQTQRRPQQRRRRPTHRTRTTTTTTTSTTTTEEPVPVTEVFEVQKTQSVEENYSGEVQRPHRRRRPTRLRTTTTPPPETTKPEETERPFNRQRYRNRVRPTASAETIEEMPTNHKAMETVSVSGAFVPSSLRDSFISDINNQFKPQQVTEDLSVSYENEVAKIEPKPEIGETENETENYPKVVSYGTTTEFEELNSHGYQVVTERAVEPTETSTVEEVPTQPRKRMRFTTTTTSTTTEQPPTSHILTPENEVDYDYSTPTAHFEPTKESITIQEVHSPESENEETTLATTTPSTTTSTTTETTTKSHRIRGRPIKYDNKNRPRFSVKEYRQRLNQYSSSSTETPPRSTTESVFRGRIPSRSRRPVTVALMQEEEQTERSRFTPKDPRHGATNANGNEVVEKKVNTRLRPFGRQRSTTEAPSTTQRISIKPNIFSNLRRPPPVSLRQRIMNKYSRNTTVEKTTPKPSEVESSSESSEAVETTVIYNAPTTESATEFDVRKTAATEGVTESVENQDEADMEIMKNESYLQSQRVSDLTSSAQKEYETPGLFKAVSPNSRRIPNYFTISTDDPILPIEAFFPNINKLSKSDSS